MTIRHFFSPDDFKGSGQLIVRNSSPEDSVNYQFKLSVSFKIGYILSAKGTFPCRISLCDGMVVTFEDNKDLCNHLNHDQQGYHPMTDREAANVLLLEGNRFPI